MPLTHFSAKTSHDVSEQADALEKIMRHHRHHDVELEISVRARPGDAAVVSDHLRADHHERFAHDRVHFARHDRAARLRRRQLNLADPAARAAAEPANIVRDLEQADRDRLELAARFDDRVLAALRFEMILRFAKRDAGALLEMAHHFGRKIADADSSPVPTAVPPSASSSQNRDRFLRALSRISDLLRVAAEFLAEPDRRRIHQMGAADLDDVPKFLRLCLERAVQFFERRHETVLQLFRRADVNRGWDHVVARLTHVDVIVRVNRIARADRFAGELAATIGDDFVRVRVRARAGAGLENVERKMLVELALDHFFRRLDDERGAMRIEQTEIVIGLRRGPFDQAERANERPAKIDSR